MIVFIPISFKIVSSHQKTLDTDRINVKNLDIVNASLLEKIDFAIIEIPCEKTYFAS